MSARRRAAVGPLLGAAALMTAAPAAAENFVQSARLVAARGGAGDQFGFSAAATPDGSTIVAGAPAARVAGHAKQGAAYVFARGRRGWRLLASLTSPHGSAGDLFGISVAISSDGATVVAGAQGAGAAYVFRRRAAGWSATAPVAKLTGGASGNFFGTAVAISADGSTVAAGADQESVGGTFQQGAAYVFGRPAGGWASEPPAAELTASNGGQSDYLGYSVSISSDGSTILAGAPFAAVGSVGGQGAVYAFRRPTGGWGGEVGQQHETAELTGPDGMPGDALGVSVAASADGSILSAGAVGATVLGHPSQGALYVFESPTVSKLTAARGGADHDLGGAVSSLGDGSLIGGGAPGAQASGHGGQGLIDLFHRPGTGWRSSSSDVALTDLDSGPGGHLGAALALAARGAVVVAGAPGELVARHRGQGAVYVFTRARRASSGTSLKCGGSTCTATVIDTRDAFATGVVKLTGSGSSCRLRPTRSAGVATCRLSASRGAPRAKALYGGDRLDLPSVSGT